MKQLYKKISNNYWIMYTFSFIFLSFITFSYFIIYGKSLISNGDGIQQHFNSVVYFGEYMRNIFQTLLSEHKLVIPTWDFSLGMGADIFTTLHYYAFGDPLNLLYIFTPITYSEYLYDFLFFLRLFLAGMTFSLYIKRFGKSNFSTLLGSITYIFCSYVFVIPTIHPYFLNPLIYLPLLLLGIEKIFSKESPKLFIIMVFLSSISNFYFLYMLSVLIFIYACIRFFSFHREKRIKNIFIELKNFILYYLIGICMSGAILLPVIMTTLNTGRMADRPTINLLYGTTYYKKLFTTFLTFDAAGDYTLMGFGCIPLLLIFFIFFNRKKYTQLKTTLLILSIFTIFPLFGSALNGFSYVTNRWIFALSLLIGTLVAFTIEDIKHISLREGVTLIILSFLYTLLIIYTNQKINSNVLIIVLLLNLCAFIWTIYAKSIISWKHMQIFTMILLCGNIIINSYYLYSPTQGNYIKLFVNHSGALASITESTGAAIPKDTDEFYRYGDTNNHQSIMYNASALNRNYSTSGYYSLINSNVTAFSKEILSSTERAETKYAGFDERTIPQTLASTKYFSIQQGTEEYLPFGFTNKVSSYTAKTQKSLSYNKTFDVYQNKYYLPFGFTYENYITSEEWNKLNFIEREEAMLQTCYVKNPDNISLPQNNNLSFSNQTLDYEIEDSDDVHFSSGKITVKKPNASIKIKFTGIQQSETYLAFQNLQYNLPPGNNSPLPDDALIDVTMNNRKKTLRLYTPNHNWYNGITDLAINAGYEKIAPASITLSFKRAGIYTYDNMSVYALPFGKNYISSINLLKTDCLSDVKLGNGEVSGKLSVDKNKILCLSIPYSKGWTGYVDGKQVPLLQLNNMFTGINIASGTHTIVLKYSSPYLSVGIFLTILGVFLFWALSLYENKVHHQ